MEKLRLDLADLAIESFDPVAQDGGVVEGTVHGYITDNCPTEGACPYSENPDFPCGGTNYPIGCPHPTLEPCTYPVSICTGPPGETEVATCYTVCASCEGMNTCYTGCGGCPTDGPEETCANYVTCDGGHFC